MQMRLASNTKAQVMKKYSVVINPNDENPKEKHSITTIHVKDGRPRLIEQLTGEF